MEIIVGSNQQDAASLAAEWMARRIRSAVRLRGACRIAVSGGGTPASMFDVMTGLDIPWPAVHVFQVDERCAPDGDPDRNAGQLHDHLLSEVAVPKRNIHLMPVTSASLRRAAASYAKAIATAPIDIVHLGIGDDGHTASWPPGDPVIDDVASVALSAEYNGRVRMTLTPTTVNGARARMMLAVGTSKAAPVAGWLLHRADLPVTRVKRSNTTVILDAAAASQLHHD